MKCPKCGSNFENAKQVEDYLPDLLQREYKCSDGRPIRGGDVIEFG